MHGDFSRRTFDALDAYRAVLLQQGRVLLDADVNEQADITAHHDEVRTRDIVGRSGGPAPEADEPGPFALVGPSGNAANRWRFEGEPWADLRITPGTYYVDGVLVEGGDPPPRGWALGNQPHLGVISATGEPDDPGLPEPAAEGRYVAYLDVWQRQVTFDEDPALLEPALGGPDTTTRSQTVWQVRLAPLDKNELCSDLHAEGLQVRTPRRMVAALAAQGALADPCEITATGGYQRLENQLYRVQVHDEPDATSTEAPDGTFLWSRENGSVVAGVDALEVVDADTAVLTLDRVGRDDELSFRERQLVELTSTGWELRGRRGLLADTGAPTGLELPVTWRDGGPPSLDALGEAPILRRWEGGPAPLAPTASKLEGGIEVRFPAGGRARTGDYWLLPARTVRLAYGLTQLGGTIEWPPGGRGDIQQPPVGPVHHLAPLAILGRAAGEVGAWSLESDCRRLFPPLTGLATLDLVGGDGQEAMPEDALPEPVRVAVRSGARPIAGALVRFTASDGGALAPPDADPAVATIRPAANGVADVRWRLNPSGPTTQTLMIRLLDDHRQPIDAPVVVTGRLSVARQVAWDPVCKRFSLTRTVQDALQGILRAREIRLLGGDGQQVTAQGEVVQRPIRVVVDDGCGPVEGAAVTALAGSPFTGFGFVARAKDGELAPETLNGTGADERATVPTDENGVAAFWWEPAFGNGRWATLDIVLDGAGDAPIRVTANLDLGGSSGRTRGVHITGLDFETGVPFGNDETIGVDDLASGIRVTLDGPVLASTVKGKPVMRVILDLPWPLGDDGQTWSSGVPVGFRDVELAAVLIPEGDVLRWRPSDDAGPWLQKRLFEVLTPFKLPPIVGRFVIDGWAIVSEKDPRQHLNGHADAVVVNASGRTALSLPTDDEIAGGQFVQWFRLASAVERRFADVPDVIGRTEAVARREVEAVGLVALVTAKPAEVRKGLVVGVEPAPGTSLPEGSTVTVVVSSGRIG